MVWSILSGHEKEKNEMRTPTIAPMNATIERVWLGDDEHGGLSAFVHLRYSEGSGQGFGGYRLYAPDYKGPQKQFGNTCGLFIWRCMQVGGVSAWEDLPGKNVRVIATHDKVKAIGHILKEDWFDPQEEFEALKMKE
jgi:hypothetical protein